MSEHTTKKPLQKKNRIKKAKMDPEAREEQQYLDIVCLFMRSGGGGEETKMDPEATAQPPWCAEEQEQREKHTSLKEERHANKTATELS